MGEFDRGTVPMEGCGAEVFHVQLGSFVDMYDVVGQLLLRLEIMGIDEAVRVEILRRLAIPPKNRNRMDGEGVVNLFCGPTESLLVFKGEDKSVGPIKIQLRPLTRNSLPTTVI